MTIFVVFRVVDPSKVEAEVQREFPNDHFKVADDEWLISATGTAQELSHRLGITSPENTTRVGPAMVFSMANYYGRATTEIWDWIKSKLEKTSG